ncbi:hypothetical protein OF83DRAFT_1195508 [Amylostereum chailletii]|nr:hypothetical protein OF83DRAFT_1195508 [Amylostereum chailletii]
MASHPLATDIPSIPTASQGMNMRLIRELYGNPYVSDAGGPVSAGAMVLPPSQPSDFNLPGTDLVQPPPDRRDSRLRTTDQHKPVQQSVKLSFPEIRVNVALVNPFPDSPTSMAWEKHALLVGAGRAANGSHVLARMQQQPEYTRALSPLTIARICHFRADIKSITDRLITTEFDLGVPSTPGYNDKVHKLLKDYNYIFPHSAAEIGIKVMHAAIFADGFAAEYQDRFPRRVNASTGEIEYAVTKSFVAVCYTGVYASLNDKTKAADPPPPIIPGKKAKSNKYEFSSDNYLDVYRGHMLSLDAGEVQRGEDGFHVFMHDLYMKASTYGTTAVQAAAPNIKTAPIDWVIQDGPESDVDASE